jgi:hypothetical protein
MRYQKYKTFKEVRALYTVEKWFHTPWHFSQSGQYVCFLEGDLECYKWDDEYVVRFRR